MCPGLEKKYGLSCIVYKHTRDASNFLDLLTDAFVLNRTAVILLTYLALEPYANRQGLSRDYEDAASRTHELRHVDFNKTIYAVVR